MGALRGLRECWLHFSTSDESAFSRYRLTELWRSSDLSVFMRITPTCTVICVHYQHALVPNLDFDSGTALNKLCVMSHESHSPNTWQSFLFSIIHLDSRIIFHSHQLWHLRVWGQTSADGSRTDGEVYSCLQDICCQSNCIITIKDTGRNYKMCYLCSKKQCCAFFFLDFLFLLLVMRSQSTSMMLEKGFSRYP